MASIVSTFHCSDMSSLVKYLFKSFARFTKLGNFLIIPLGRSLHVWDTSLLSDMCFVNIFSQAVACFLVLLTISFEERRFVFLMASNVPHFSFMNHVLDVLSGKSVPHSRPQGPSPMLFYGFMFSI